MKKSILLILFLCITIKAFCCDCLTPKPYDAVKIFDFVFEGKLIEYKDSTHLYSIMPGQGQIKYSNFEILRIYKGISKFQKVISIINSGSNCDFNFNNYQIGSTFLIYAYSTKENTFNAKFLGTDICTGTKLVSDIKDKDELFFYNFKEKWTIPDDVNYLQQKIDPVENTSEKKSNYSLLTIIVTISVLLNVVIIYILIRNKTS